MKRKPLSTLLAAAVGSCAIVLAGCGSSTPLVKSNATQSSPSSTPGSGSGSASPSNSEPGQPMTTLTVGYVPSTLMTALFVGEQEGFFRGEGINLVLTSNDSGPALLSSVLQGSYQLAFTALFPALLAYGKGAPIQLVAAASLVGPGQADEAVVVRAGSAVKSLKDLTGKTVGTNALTSAVTLGVQLGVDHTGGNSHSVHFIALPFAQEIQEVQTGQIAAAGLIEPFSNVAIGQGLRTVGNPIDAYLPAGTPYAVYLTSQTTMQRDGAAIRRFTVALRHSQTYANAHPADVRAVEQTDLKIPSADLNGAPIPKQDSNLSRSLISQFADTMLHYGYLSKVPDINRLMP